MAKEGFNTNFEAAGSGAGFQPVSTGILPAMIWAGKSAVACQHHRGLEARSDRLEACPTTDECNSTSEFELTTNGCTPITQDRHGFISEDECGLVVPNRNSNTLAGATGCAFQV